MQLPSAIELNVCLCSYLILSRTEAIWTKGKWMNGMDVIVEWVHRQEKLVLQPLTHYAQWTIQISWLGAAFYRFHYQPSLCHQKTQQQKIAQVWHLKKKKIIICTHVIQSVKFHKLNYFALQMHLSLENISNCSHNFN